MADDTRQETKEQDPVEAIRKSLRQALRALLRIGKREEWEREVLEREVEKSGPPSENP